MLTTLNNNVKGVELKCLTTVKKFDFEHVAHDCSVFFFCVMQSLQQKFLTKETIFREKKKVFELKYFELYNIQYTLLTNVSTFHKCTCTANASRTYETTKEIHMLNSPLTSSYIWTKIQFTSGIAGSFKIPWTSKILYFLDFLFSSIFFFLLPLLLLPFPFIK